MVQTTIKYEKRMKKREKEKIQVKKKRTNDKKGKKKEEMEDKQPKRKVLSSSPT